MVICRVKGCCKEVVTVLGVEKVYCGDHLHGTDIFPGDKKKLQESNDKAWANFIGS